MERRGFLKSLLGGLAAAGVAAKVETPAVKTERILEDPQEPTRPVSLYFYGAGGGLEWVVPDINELEPGRIAFRDRFSGSWPR